MRAVVLGVCVWLVTAAAAWAQFDTATVLGTVRDSSEAVVPGAKVTLTAVETGISAVKVSGVDGNYEFAAVRPGLYVVTSEKNGFSVALVDGVQVQVGARLRVDLRMSVGQLSEKVEVSSSQPLVETDSSQRGQVISGEQIRALPLVSREYSSLALLTTGVKLAGSSLTTGNTPREGAFNVNGLRSTVNNFLIDGIDNNAYGTSNQGFSNQVMQPPPDAITEFKVVTNNMSAEYGRAAGATINVNYRSGTNTIHGTAWEFLRDTSMNATGYFKPPTGKPTLDRHQFGGVFGGPLVRNKAFVFGDYEGLRQTRRSTGFATIATPTQRQGILTVDVRDPRSGVTYPAGTAIPMTDFARKVLAGLPDSNVAGTTNNYTTLQEFTADSNKGGVKVDVQFSPAAAMFARYGMRNLTTDDQPNIPLPSGGAGNGHIYAKNRQFVLGSTWTPTAQSLLETRFGYSWTQAGKNPPSLGSGSAQDQFGIPGLPTDPRIAGGLPTQLITGYSDLGRQATNPQWQYPTVYNPKINYTWLAGAHSLKSGYEFQHILTEVQDVNPLYGRDTYNGQFSRPAGIASNNLYNLADFMLGLRAQYALSSVLVANLIRKMHFAYVQDDWRIGSNLTLNLGLRYEFSTPYWEKDNVLSNFDPANNRMILATDGSISDRALINPDRNNFGPRLGFAYTITPRTVVRGGYGISYIHFSRAGGGDVLPINGPQVVNAVVNQTVPSAPAFVPAEQGYPAGLADPSQFNPLTANITYMPDDFHSSPVQSWHISIQRELIRNMLIDVAYVGNRGDDLLLFANYNQANPNNAAGTIPLQDRRPNPAFSDITYAFNGGKSRYKALQAKWEWRVSRDVTLLNSLTAVGGEGQRRAVARELERQLPRAAGLPEHGGGLRPVQLSPALQQHDELRLGAALRRRQALALVAIAARQRAGRRLGARGHPLAVCRRAGDVHLHARCDVRRLRHRPGFPRRQQLSAERDLRSDGDGRRAHHQQLVQPRLRGAAHRPEPAVRQRGAQFRPRAEILVAGSGRLQAGAARRPGAVRAAHRGVQRAEQDELPGAKWQPERGRLRHHHLDLRSAPAAAGRQGAVVGRAMTVVVALALLAPPFETPILIAHRGASGHRPEHTLEAYRLAVEMGADFIEPDLVSTKDGVLLARHENEIGATTDAAERFPDRKRSKVIDGQSIAGWFSEDFTLAEMQTLRARERLAFRSHAYDGKFPIATFDEVIELAQRLGAARGRPVGVYPETKHPTYFRSIGLPLEEKLVASLAKHGWNRGDAPVFIQSFEQENLRELHKKTPVPLIQLVSDAKLASDEGLASMAAYAKGIGPEKRLVLPVNADGSLGTPTGLVERAHRAGLLVHVWTLRADKEFLPAAYKGDAAAEFREFKRLGVDGVFSDFPDIGAAAFGRDGRRK